MADNGTGNAIGRVRTLLSPKPAPPNQPETAAEQSEYAAGKLVGFAQSGLKAGYELASMASDAIVFAGNIVTGGVASQTKYVQDALQRNAARGAGIVNTASHPIDAANSFLQSIEERQNAAEVLRANGNFYEAGKIEGALAQEVMPTPAGVTKVAKVGKASKAGGDGVMVGKKATKPKGGAWDYAPNWEKWEQDGGRVVQNSDGSAKYIRKDGVEVTYNKEGFPDFSPHATRSVEIPDMKGDHYWDFKAANEKIGRTGSKPPEGFTWHHVQDGKTMLLVPQGIHNAPMGGFSHAGGVFSLGP